jgi:hypothetical protein
MRRSIHSFRPRALLACVPALGLVLMAGAGPASAAHARASGPAGVRAALEHLLAGWHPANHALGGAGPDAVTSRNWSGYADVNSSGNTYKRVKGQWTEPAITGCKANTLSAVVFWVGLDGYNDGTVEQAGTAAICMGNGTTTPEYATWWEMYPRDDIQWVGTTVRPGDQIAASAIKRGGRYTLAVTDATTPANSFSTGQIICHHTVCGQQSAEWIAEAPSSTAGELPLPHFGTWVLKHARVVSGTTLGTISSFPDEKILMDNSSGQVIARPGPLNATGNRFRDAG